MKNIKLAVVGAGPVGLVTAYSLLQKGFSVDLFDPFLFRTPHISEAPQASIDRRYISLSYGSIALLESIDLHLADLAQTIEAVHISTSGFWGACTMYASENDVPALAYSIHYQDLQKALLKKLEELEKLEGLNKTSTANQGSLTCISAAVTNIQNIKDIKDIDDIEAKQVKPIQRIHHLERLENLDDLDYLNNLAFLEYKQNQKDKEGKEGEENKENAEEYFKKTYHHIFICEGGVFQPNDSSQNSTKMQPKALTGNSSHLWSSDQKQTAYIGFLNLPHAGAATPNQSRQLPKNTAWECFTDEGPLAILPYHAYPSPRTQASHVIVWCQRREKNIFSQAVQNSRDLSGLQLNSAAARDLQTRIESLQGFTTPALRRQLPEALQKIEWQQTFDLGMRMRGALQDQHLTYVGNAAQMLHPVAGQGLNLGLRQALRATRELATHVIHLQNNKGIAVDSVAIKPYVLNQFELNIDRAQMMFLTAMMAKGFEKKIFSGVFSAGLQFLQSIPILKKKLANIFMYGGR